jgi:hypothetical protein
VMSAPALVHSMTDEQPQSAQGMRSMRRAL